MIIFELLAKPSISLLCFDLRSKEEVRLCQKNKEYIQTTPKCLYDVSHVCINTADLQDLT